MNGYDILVEISVGSVQRDAKRHVLGQASMAAWHLPPKELRRDHAVEAVCTWHPRRQAVNLRPLTTVIAAIRVTIGSTLGRVGRFAKGVADGPAAPPGSPGPAKTYCASCSDGLRDQSPLSSAPLAWPPS